jgi:hypothetical protein
MQPANSNRPLDGQTLTELVNDLATVHTIAWSLSHNLEPPSEEDRAAGAEPLSKEQIQVDLAKICRTVESIALHRLKVEPGEWSDALLAIP